MKTPEEIYKYYTGETLDDKQLTKKAMIEYGKQQAVGFMNWRNDVKNFDKNIIRRNPKITTEQLYKEYLKTL